MLRHRLFLVDRNVAALSKQLPLRKFRIEIEEMRDNLFLIAVEADAVGRLDGCIERLVGFDQLWEQEVVVRVVHIR